MPLTVLRINDKITAVVPFERPVDNQMRQSPFKAVYNNFWAGLITDLVENTSTCPDEIIRRHCQSLGVSQQAVTDRLIAHLHNNPSLQ